MGVLKSTPVLPYKQGQKAEKEEEKSMLHAESPKPVSDEQDACEMQSIRGTVFVHNRQKGKKKIIKYDGFRHIVLTSRFMKHIMYLSL